MYLSELEMLLVTGCDCVSELPQTSFMNRDLWRHRNESLRTQQEIFFDEVKLIMSDGTNVVIG